MPRRRPAVRRRRPALLAAWIPVLALELGFGSVPAQGAEPIVLSAPTAAEDSDSIDPDESAGSSSFLSRNRRSLLWITGGGAAASAIAAVFYRREANDRYDEYQETADPESISDLYDEAQHLDEIATGFFIGAEALFVAVIYLGFFVEPSAADHTALAPAALAPITPVVERGTAGDARVGLAWHF